MGIGWPRGNGMYASPSDISECQVNKTLPHMLFPMVCAEVKKTLSSKSAKTENKQPIVWSTRRECFKPVMVTFNNLMRHFWIR